MNTDLDTLLTALYVELDDRPGHPLEVNDAELVCLAVAQVLLRFNDERHWLRSAPALIGHLFPLLSQSEYNRRVRTAGDLVQTALRWLAAGTPSSADMVRLWDGTPVPCGASRETAKRSDLAGWDETDPGIFPQRLRQRIESVNWSLKGQLGLEAHGGRVLSGLWARVLQRLLAHNAAIWHNWACGAERKRWLIHYDHPTQLTST